MKENITLLFIMSNKYDVPESVNNVVNNRGFNIDQKDSQSTIQVWFDRLTMSWFLLADHLLQAPDIILMH